MLNFEEINNIKGAQYNPRVIEDIEFLTLKESLSNLGFIIPIIVNDKNNVIVAGHQRTKAAKELNFDNIPVIRVDDIELGDEIKLNQLHNAVDKEPAKMPNLKYEHDEGFTSISYTEFDCYEWYPVYIREICQLIIKYGNILSCVVSDGEVLIGGNYVKACQLLRYDINTYVLNSDLKDYALSYLYKSYGKYTYENTEKNTYIQGLAQLHRNPTRTDGKKAFKSQLYEKQVIPYLMENPEAKVLDFACGKGAYVDMLNDEYDITGLEFFNNNGQTLDISKGHLMIDELINKIKIIEKFDVIVCDSVVNSVDSHEAEEHILTCLNLFLKEGGKLFISGRSLKHMLRDTMYKYDITTGKRFIEFVDERGLTSNFRKGHWYYQKYHSDLEIKNNLNNHGFIIIKETWGRVFNIKAIKKESIEDNKYIEALKFEFNLPLPNNSSYNRHNEMLKLYNYDSNFK